MEIAGKKGEFFLRGCVFGSGGVERGRSGFRLAAGGAGGRFRVGGFLSFLFGLGGEVGGED
jgi:hypothetical protein